MKVFCDLAETESFTKAAQINGVTQSAVSQQIRGLEERYGKRLLERRRGSVKPTAAGDILHRSSRAILHAFNEMEAQLQGLSNIVTGSVRPVLMPRRYRSMKARLTTSAGIEPDVS